MYTAKDFEELDDHELIELLGKLTRQYTSELASDPTHIIDDQQVYLLSVLIKEINMREKSMARKNESLRNKADAEIPKNRFDN